MTAHLWPFLVLSAILIVVPGPDMALVARNALVGGRRAGMATSAGSAAGLCVWTLAASVGLAALLRASEPAFLALRVAGAAYLLYLGARALWTAVRGDGGDDVERLRRRTITSQRRAAPGTPEQSRQPEDRRLLHELPAAVRAEPSRRVPVPALARSRLLRDDARVALRLQRCRRARGRRAAAVEDPSRARGSDGNSARRVRAEARDRATVTISSGATPAARSRAPRRSARSRCGRPRAAPRSTGGSAGVITRR